VALHLKFLSDCDYANDHFLDVMVYDNGSNKFCIILNEERILIVDALTKERVEDYAADDLHSIEVRPVFAQEEEVESLERGRLPHQSASLAQSMHTTNSGERQPARPQVQMGHELFIRIYTDQFQGANNIKDIMQRQEAIKARNLINEQNQIQISGQLPGDMSPTSANYFGEGQTKPIEGAWTAGGASAPKTAGAALSPRFGADTSDKGQSPVHPSSPSTLSQQPSSLHQSQQSLHVPQNNDGQRLPEYVLIANTTNKQTNATDLVEKLKGKVEMAGSQMNNYMNKLENTYMHKSERKRGHYSSRNKKMVIDGFAFFIKNPEKLEECKRKLENYLWYVQIQRGRQGY